MNKVVKSRTYVSESILPVARQKTLLEKNPTKFIILLPFCNELVPLPLIPSYKSFYAASLNDGFLTVQSVELRF